MVAGTKQKITHMYNGLVQAFLQALQKGLQYFVVTFIRKYFSAYSKYREVLRDNPLRVFISYDLNDEEPVRALYAKLKKQVGINPWLDRESSISKIPRTDVSGWESTLLKALHDAECVVICISKQSINNKGYFQKKEVPLIMESAKTLHEVSTYLVLARIDGCSVPSKYAETPSLELYSEQGYERLLDDLTTHAIKSRNELRNKRGVKFEHPKQIL